ncbi:hypothetical protein F4808DRAFT_186842 [Astrocystis sublimbata]|nr:hypothetical protein F4808DRAFT_186842 [Astrocystis sublimbata]
MSLRQIMTAAMLAFTHVTYAADKGVQVPAQQAQLGSDTVAGCFSSLGDMKLDSTDEFNAQGYCAPRCRKKHLPVGATYAHACYCGTKMPNHESLVKDSKCNEPCPGYDPQACGGLNVWTVYNTGVQFNVEEADPDPTSSTTSAAPTSTSQSSTSDTPTAPAQSDEGDKSSKNDGTDHKMVVGIAVGVVVGILVVAAVGVGAFLYFRRKRGAEMEEEKRRNDAVNAFISGGKPPRSSGGVSIADSRMDPVMNRRMSDGSIADNHDYSRRILRVTNA